MLTSRISKQQMEVLRYLFFGGLTTLVNWAAYAVMVQLIGLQVAVSNAIAWVLAVAFAFIVNKLWVFQSRSWESSVLRREVVSFYGSRIVVGLVELVGVPLLFYIGLDYPLFGIEGFLAKAMVSIVVVVLNYVFSKLFVFRSRE
jgi:putative flippase GtrA